MEGGRRGGTLLYCEAGVCHQQYCQLLGKTSKQRGVGNEVSHGAVTRVCRAKKNKGCSKIERVTFNKIFNNSINNTRPKLKAIVLYMVCLCTTLLGSSALVIIVIVVFEMLSGHVGSSLHHLSGYLHCLDVDCGPNNTRCALCTTEE